MTLPQVDDGDKTYSPKVEQIVTEITKLNLLEVAELTNLLKRKLNLPDAPAFGFGPISSTTTTAAAPSPTSSEPIVSFKESCVSM